MTTKIPRTIADQAVVRWTRVVSAFAWPFIVLHLFEVYPFGDRAFGLCLITASVVYSVIESRFKRTWRQRILDADLRLCLCCGYDLRGSSESGNCPECGQRYTSQHLERLWSDWMVRQFPKWRSRLASGAHVRQTFVQRPGETRRRLTANRNAENLRSLSSETYRDQ